MRLPGPYLNISSTRWVRCFIKWADFRWSFLFKLQLAIFYFHIASPRGVVHFSQGTYLGLCLFCIIKKKQLLNIFWVVYTYLSSKLNSKCSDSYCLGFCFIISSRLKHLPLKSSLFCSILTSPPPGVWATLSSDPILAFAFSLKSSLCCSILTSPPVGLCVVLAREPILAWVSQVTFSSNIYKKGSIKQTRCS